MIIKRIAAENILKYRRLEVANIPARGQIAISGSNESGKTAIGETICLGLFGRTFSLGPDEFVKAIRWGEFRGSVVLEFTGRDGLDYVIHREIDCDGNHHVRLDQIGDRHPCGGGSVQEAINEVVGFTFDRFVDSFYLAQREIEMPRAGSAKLKALIGLDSLERVAGGLCREREELGGSIEGLEADVATAYQQLIEIDPDQELLGRLQEQRGELGDAIAEADQQAATLSSREEAIAQAGDALAATARSLLQTGVASRYGEWRERQSCAQQSAADAVACAAEPGADRGPEGLSQYAAALHPFERGLAEYEKVRTLAHLHRDRLERLLRDDSDGNSAQDDEAGRVLRFCEGRRSLVQMASRLERLRKPIQLVGLALGVATLAAWGLWGAHRVRLVPELSEWLQANLAVGGVGAGVPLLGSAASGTVLTLIVFVFWIQRARRLRSLDQQIKDLDTRTEKAKEDVGFITSLDNSLLPDAVAGLRGTANDLLSSAAAAFAAGDGAPLVKPEVHEEKMAAILRCSEVAQEALERVHLDVRERAGELRSNLEENRRGLDDVERRIDVERQRREQAKPIEERLVQLEGRLTDLQRHVRVRELGQELIDGTIRRIQSRFHPELRRFVGKVLPRITNGRYRHLQIDDELNVRVFSADKNDFVGLEEISNGTHRQLMLCLRLALSQALIASTTKAPQFIFLDEPFAFFDQERTRWAFDMLRRISPQLSQIWLVAQEFDEGATFDMAIRCEVGTDTLVVNGSVPHRQGEQTMRPTGETQPEPSRASYERSFPPPSARAVVERGRSGIIPQPHGRDPGQRSFEARRNG